MKKAQKKLCEEIRKLQEDPTTREIEPKNPNLQVNQNQTFKLLKLGEDDFFPTDCNA